MKSMLFISIMSIVSFFGFNSNIETPTPSDGSCRLQLVGLECIVTEGFMTPDAIYFKVDWGDGETEWPSRRLQMVAGDYVDLRSVNSTSIYDNAIFKMFDDDTWDADDHLGTKIISCNDSGAGEKYVSFTQDGAHYRLHYKVF